MKQIKRKIAISDIHGMHQLFLALLHKVKYNPIYDKLVIVGDLIDKGDDSKSVLDFLSKSMRNDNTLGILGNHDNLFLEFLLGNFESTEIWLRKGGLNTLSSYVGEGFLEQYGLYEAREYILKYFPHHIETLTKMKLFYEDINHIFVHAGFNPQRLDWRQSSKKEFLEIRNSFISSSTKTKKTVVFGHTPTYFIHGDDNVWFKKQGKTVEKIGIDGRAYNGGQLNALIIENETSYKTEYVTAAELLNRSAS